MSVNQFRGNRHLAEIKAELFKALAHPHRVRVLEILVDGERTVSELVREIGIEASHLSQQLAVLRRAGVVTRRKEGTSVIYALRDETVIELLAVAKRFLLTSLQDTRDLLTNLAAEDATR